MPLSCRRSAHGCLRLSPPIAGSFSRLLLPRSEFVRGCKRREKETHFRKSQTCLSVSKPDATVKCAWADLNWEVNEIASEVTSRVSELFWFKSIQSPVRMGLRSPSLEIKCASCEIKIATSLLLLSSGMSVGVSVNSTSAFCISDQWRWCLLALLRLTEAMRRLKGDLDFHYGRYLVYEKWQKSNEPALTFRSLALRAIIGCSDSTDTSTTKLLYSCTPLLLTSMSHHRKSLNITSDTIFTWSFHCK